MVWELKCTCDSLYETKIDSMELFQEIKNYFSLKIEDGDFIEIPVKEPYFVGKSKLQTINWYADKWYLCRKCGCLWEFIYPDFPANGFVRKFKDGAYKMMER